MAANTRDLLLRLLGDSSNLKKAMADADGAVEKHGTSLKQLAGTVGSAYAASKVIEFGKASVEAASNMAEAQSKVNVIFGESAPIIQAWSDTTASALGISKNQALDAASTFATFGKSAGLAGEDLSTFGIDLTTLSADLASFHNTSPEQAIEAIGAALRGESEPIRQYGVLLDDATLKQQAMKLGIYDGSGALTAQQKVLAAQAEIMAQTGDAQGDFARTSDGLAGSQKQLSAQWADMQAQIGTALVPVMKQLVGVLSSVAEWFSSLDEDTQAWIVRIGLLGGGLVLATRAVNGIVGPLKQLGIIGKSADKALEGVQSSGSKLSASLSAAVTPALVGVGAALATWEGLGAVAADSLRTAEGAAHDLSTVADEELYATFMKIILATVGVARNTRTVKQEIEDLTRANIDGARRLVANADAIGLNEEMLGLLEAAIAAVEAEQAQGAKTAADAAVATGEATAAVVELTEAEKTQAQATADLNKMMIEGVQAAFEHQTATALDAQAAEDAADSTDRHADAVDALADVIDQHNDQLQERIDLETQLYEDEQSRLDTKYAFEQQLRDLNDATAEYNALLADSETTSKEAEDATFAMAERYRDAASAFAESKGAADGSRASIDLQVESLYGVAAALDPSSPLRVQLLRYIEDLLKIPKTVETKLEVTPGSRPGRRAGGGPVRAGEPYIVGEYRPELFVPDENGTIIPRIGTAGAGGTTVIQNHFHGPVLGEADFIRRLEEGRQDAIRRGAILVSS